jgi:hypothetical protein
MQAAAETSNTLQGYGGWVVLIAIGAMIILSGLVIVGARYWLTDSPSGRRSSAPDDGTQRGRRSGGSLDSDSMVVRSWIAIVLVGGLLIFCAVALAINDPSLRSTLFGGLIASVGAAVAFYFSAKSSDQARKDILTASLGTAEVPKLEGLTVAQAQAAISKTPLQLVVSTQNAQSSDVVTDQSPAPNTDVRNGSRVLVDTKAS